MQDGLRRRAQCVGKRTRSPAICLNIFVRFISSYDHLVVHFVVPGSRSETNWESMCNLCTNEHDHFAAMYVQQRSLRLAIANVTASSCMKDAARLLAKHAERLSADVAHSHNTVLECIKPWLLPLIIKVTHMRNNTCILLRLLDKQAYNLGPSRISSRSH